MKYLLKSVFALTILFTSAHTFAQDQGQRKSPQDRANTQFQWMKQNIGLTDDQNSKVFNVLFQSAKDADAARNSDQGADKRQAMQEIQSNRDAQLKAILTGDQFTKYQAHEQEMKAKMQERRANQGN